MGTTFTKKSTDITMSIFGLFKKKISDSPTDSASEAASQAIAFDPPTQSTEPEFLIVGLGNPGEKYDQTRHNIGWMVLAELCKKYGVQTRKVNADYRAADITVYGKCLRLVQPTTYMNNSGRAVKQALASARLTAEQAVVIVDEYNFPVGKVHVKVGGSDGGHNGISSIIEEAGTDRFIRLRCGIGNRFGAGGLVDYVLSRFETEETEARNAMIAKAVQAIERIAEVNFSRAMSDVNSGKLYEVEEKRD